MKSHTRRAKMIRNAKCARFSIVNKTFATGNYNCEIVKS
jgi:hypothetical protein